MIDRIAATLDAIPRDQIPDFRSLDRHGGVTQMLREAALQLAEFGWPDIADAAALIDADVIFFDALRIREIEMLAHRNRRTLDGRRHDDA